MVIALQIKYLLEALIATRRCFYVQLKNFPKLQALWTDIFVSEKILAIVTLAVEEEEAVAVSVAVMMVVAVALVEEEILVAVEALAVVEVLVVVEVALAVDSVEEAMAEMITMMMTMIVPAEVEVVEEDIREAEEEEEDLIQTTRMNFTLVDQPQDLHNVWDIKDQWC